MDVGNTGVTVGDTAYVPAGSTVLVAIVNPAVNSPHNTGVPGEQGSVRDGIDVDPEPGGAALTVDGARGAFVRNVFCGQTVVPSTNATLLDNYGVAPIETPLPGACDL